MCTKTYEDTRESIVYGSKRLENKLWSVHEMRWINVCVCMKSSPGHITKRKARFKAVCMLPFSDEGGEVGGCLYAQAHISA